VEIPFQEAEIAFTDSRYTFEPAIKYSTKSQVVDDRHEGQPKREIDQGEIRSEDLVATTIAPTRSRAYITDLSQNIYAGLKGYLDVKTWPKVARALPVLIKAFAIRIGRKDSTKMHRDIMHLFTSSIGKSIFFYLLILHRSNVILPRELILELGYLARRQHDYNCSGDKRQSSGMSLWTSWVCGTIWAGSEHPISKSVSYWKGWKNK